MALKVQDAEFGRYYPHGYGKNATPGFQCKVTLQIGAASYERIALTLPEEATKAVLALMIAEATKLLAVDMDSINVAGAPGDPEPEEDDRPIADIAREMLETL